MAVHHCIEKKSKNKFGNYVYYAYLCANKRNKVMTNAEKIIAVRNKIILFGGTCVSLKNSTTIVGFNSPKNRDYYMFRDVTVGGQIIGETDAGNIISIPIHWFSETHLGYILNSYLKACKEQLSDSVFKEIEEIVK